MIGVVIVEAFRDGGDGQPVNDPPAVKPESRPGAEASGLQALRQARLRLRCAAARTPLRRIILRRIVLGRIVLERIIT